MSRVFKGQQGGQCGDRSVDLVKERSERAEGVWGCGKVFGFYLSKTKIIGDFQAD